MRPGTSLKSDVDCAVVVCSYYFCFLEVVDVWGWVVFFCRRGSPCAGSTGRQEPHVLLGAHRLCYLTKTSVLLMI